MRDFMDKLRNKLAKLTQDAGVTLIELLAVVVILAIIAAVAVPAVLGQISKSKTNADKQNEQIIVDALNRLILDAEGAGDSNLTLAITGGSTTGSVTTGTVGTAQLDYGSGSTALTSNNSGSPKLEDLLLTGISSVSSGSTTPVTQGYLSSWPQPQSSSSTTWTLTKGGTTAPTPGPATSFTVGGQTYWISP